MLGRPFERRCAISCVACWLACVRSLNSKHLRVWVPRGRGEASNRPEFIYEYRLVNSNTSNGHTKCIFIFNGVFVIWRRLMCGIFIAPVVKAPAELLFDPFIYSPFQSLADLCSCARLLSLSELCCRCFPGFAAFASFASLPGLGDVAKLGCIDSLAVPGT